MGRELDSTYAAGLTAPVIWPVNLAKIAFRSGVVNVWSGPGTLAWNGDDYLGVGLLGQVGSIAEASGVQANGTTITLHGIGLSQISATPVGVTPPTDIPAPPSGQAVTWAYATRAPRGIGFSNPPSIYNDMLGSSGFAEATKYAGSIAITNGDVFAPTLGLTWGSFVLPGGLPTGAAITKVVPVVVVGTNGVGFQEVSATAGTPEILFASVDGPGTYYGADLGAASGLGALITAQAQNTLPGAASLSMAISFVGLAVYYDNSAGTVSPDATLLYESLNDIAIGAPVRLWRGLWDHSANALQGIPYQVFRGYVDKPTVSVSGESVSITLALESRIANLARASYRRYTTADQSLTWPTDIGFNWVPQLQDIALKTGT